jgi:two-component system sensor histidine kinase/response regulator
MKQFRCTTILVVEDDEAVRQSVVDILELNGFDCVAAIDGTEGLALARSLQPALIITDIAMPRCSGFDLLQECRRDEALRSIPVILITAKVDRLDSRHGMDLGADDYITKPFTEQELLSSVRARLEKKELIDELDAFAHTVAHDLKNPLATLGGRLGLLQMTMDKDAPAAMKHSVAEAVVAARRLCTIIDELLLLTGVRRMRVEMQPLDMTPLVAEALQQLEHLLGQTGAAVETRESWPRVRGHGAWVVHVWCNYISNAAKYSGPAAQIVLGSDVTADGQRARFWVRDRGPGLEATAQAALFLPFTQLSSVRPQGHGLGLSIVRRIMDKLGGSAGVESRPGEGAKFWFELPLVTPSAAT